MLESNTDRIYFVIGAIIVGALLIAGASFIFGSADGDGILGSMNSYLSEMFKGDSLPSLDPDGKK